MQADSSRSASVGHTRAAAQRPVFKQTATPDWGAQEQPETLHLALIKIRAAHELDDNTLEGVASTLSQLNRLGMGCCVVVDTEQGTDDQETRALGAKEADRVAAAIEQHPGPGTRRLDNLLGVASNDISLNPQSPSRPESHVRYRKLLMTPLRRGIIPVLAPVAYTDGQVAVQVSANDVTRALAREFTELSYKPPPDQDPVRTANEIVELQKEVSLDRLILIDPLGGIPADETQGRSHVFINMEQEYQRIREEVLQMNIGKEISASSSSENMPPLTSSPTTIHLENLHLLKDVLALLPPSSSAIITSPQDAANPIRKSTESFEVSGVGTRRQKNPLIHNLLTDKPMVSSSLPVGRLGGSKGGLLTTTVSSYPTTLSKRGMPLTILPNPHTTPWTTENITISKLSLRDPKVDLARLVHLIEDSFDRKLDAEHYLNRVDDRLAGLIVAGEYEGGAILTWETPPGIDPDISKADRSRLVPYLDKFAVLKRSQGAGGVADILFNAMVRDCFPNGVCWRSRRDNPVNKWYFERARGTWKMPDTNWTMFWTTEGVEEDEETFLDYEAVCRGVQPSWADNKAVVD
jgi:amino-acid N-acetyltransferase